MKKTIPFVSPLIVGLLGGLLVECFLCIASIIMSPFADLEESKFLIFCGINSLVSAIFIVVVVIADIIFLIELNNKKKMRLVLILQLFAVTLIGFASWLCAEKILHTCLF